MFAIQQPYLMPSQPKPSQDIESKLAALIDRQSDMYDRVVRIETRLVKFMLDHGLDANGDPIDAK